MSKELLQRGLSEADIQKCKENGIDLAALLALLMKYGPVAVQFFKDLLQIFNPPAPTPAPKP